jgi:hypothetical protein
MYFVFGDSHSACFNKVFPKNVHSYPAASAKGLNNPNSKSGVNKQIIEKISSLPEKSNIIMFFGKVDLDFIVNYKYNTSEIIDYTEYVLSIVNSYIEFIKLNMVNKNVYVCELPITHIDDKSILNIIRVESHLNNINRNLDETDISLYSKFSKIIPYNQRILLYNSFNQELKNKCKSNNFSFLEINKYFIDENGNYKIPVKYINNNKLDHHLLHNIVELFLKSL